MSKYNLSELSPEDMDKENVKLAASGVVYKERYNMPVVAELVEREQPEHLRAYFRECLAQYRANSHKIGRDEEYVRKQLEGGDSKKQ